MVVPPTILNGSKKQALEYAFNKLDYALEDVIYICDVKKIPYKEYKYERKKGKYFLLIEIDEKDLED